MSANRVGVDGASSGIGPLVLVLGLGRWRRTGRARPMDGERGAIGTPLSSTSGGCAQNAVCSRRAYSRDQEKGYVRGTIDGLTFEGAVAQPACNTNERGALVWAVRQGDKSEDNGTTTIVVDREMISDDFGLGLCRVFLTFVVWSCETITPHNNSLQWNLDTDRRTLDKHAITSTTPETGGARSLHPDKCEGP